MQVMIHGRSVDYISDFDPVDIQSNVRRNWKVSAGDYFKFPVKVGDADCFIKRFDKHDNDISGYKLLLRLKGKKITGLPIVHDVVRIKEGSKEVLYLFTEYLPGNTLENLQRTGYRFLPTKLCEDLFRALQGIHKLGYWFSDFDPKNLYRTDAGDFYLIDLDSTYPLEELPRSKMFGSKDYWSPVYNYYRHKLGFTSDEVKQLKGDAFNTLHLLYFMCLYSFYLYEDGEDLTTTTIERLNDHFNRKHKLFASTLRFCFFKQPNSTVIHQKPLTPEILTSFIDTCLFPEKKEVFISSQLKKAAVIQQPKVLFIPEGNKTIYEPGEKYDLVWNVSNVDTVTLNGDPQLFSGRKSFVAGANALHTLKIGYRQNGILKYSNYSVTIKVEPKPEIKLYASVKKVKAGKDVVIRWEVKNGKNIALYLNGSVHKSNCTAKGSLLVTLPFDDSTAGPQRSTLMLTADSQEASIQYNSGPLDIDVVRAAKFNYAWILIPLLFIALFLFALGKGCSDGDYSATEASVDYMPLVDSAVDDPTVDTAVTAPAIIDSAPPLVDSAVYPAPIPDTTIASADSTVSAVYKTNKENNFFDDFDYNYNGWELKSSAYVKRNIEGGNLNIKMQSDGASLTGRNFTIDLEQDFTISSRMNRGVELSSGTYGVYFCGNDQDTRFHLFNIDKKGNYNIYSVNNDSWISLAQGNTAYFRPGKFNILIIDKKGDKVVFKVNGEIIHEQSFNMRDGLKFGIYADNNIELYVDYFILNGYSTN
ncbi:hypothetical protein FAM09_10580 [Niastella caeni]|uniref:Protein kinase domain-containing protein n=1 Tax=Niastella caeni TaxID=2569763 RepID=A0A4S8I1C9_9BACT|nr:hypothetical protein [Niastella caeni]THU40304.1 hypothetical protein FAM09_10580 [Niastella caeni]